MTDQSTLSIYQGLSQNGDPLATVTALGRAFHGGKMMGCDTEGDGMMLALTCMCEGISPIEFVRTYHLIQGKPSMRADAMLAKFRQAGGKVSWKNLGDDDKREARAEFTFDGETLEGKYDIKDAESAVGDKLKKKDSNWQKDESAMLRARLITKMVRILAPELVAGAYTPEELEDSAPVRVDDNSPEEVAARREELERLANEPVVQPGEQIIDVEVQSQSPAAQTQAATTEVATGNFSTEEQRAEMFELCSQMGMSADQAVAQIIQACDVPRPELATSHQIAQLIQQAKDHMAQSAQA